MKTSSIGEKSYLNNLNYLKRTFKKSNQKRNSIFNNSPKLIKLKPNNKNIYLKSEEKNLKNSNLFNIIKNSLISNNKNDLDLIKNKLKKNIDNHNKNIFFNSIHKKIKSSDFNEKSTFYNSTLSNNKNNNFSNRIFSNENLIDNNNNNKKNKNFLISNNPKIYDITKDLKTIKKNKKIAKFTTTDKLNHYIINEYKFGDYETKENYQKKLKIMEQTFNIVRQKKNEEIYQRSQNYYVEDKDRDNFYYNLLNNNNNNNENFIENNHLNYKNENFVKETLNEYYLNKKEKNLKGHEKIFKKIWLLNDDEYESIDKKDDFTLSFNNLKRLMKIKKYKKKFLSPDISRKKQIFFEEQDKILLKMKKLQPGNLLKRPFKKTTENMFKSVAGVYFGIPT